MRGVTHERHPGDTVTVTTHMYLLESHTGVTDLCHHGPSALYTLAKKNQYRWPETHGEDQFVVLFGALHIEMAKLKVLSGWQWIGRRPGAGGVATTDSTNFS